MADFFTDSDDDKAVEELLSQAMDSTVLQQVAAINCAGFTDSGLPSHLETRFQKLKSFPSSTRNPNSLSTKSFSLSHPPEFRKRGEERNEKAHPKCSTRSPEEKNEENSEKAHTRSCLSSDDEMSFSPCKKIPRGKREKKGPKSPSFSSCEDSEKAHTKCLTKSPEGKSCLSSDNEMSFSPCKKIPRGKMEKKGPKSPSFSSGFSSRSVSPPVKSGCFLCSPKKKVSRKISKENRGLDLGLDWGKHGELLSDLSNNQKRMIKKAMEEEERVCREAEKIVKWAKQASARMDVSGIADELSDDDNSKYH